MTIDGIVRERLSDLMGIPLPDLTDEVARKIIIDKPINLIYLITGKTSKTFNEYLPKDTNCRKLARVLNIILLDNFDSVEEFLAVMGIDLIYIEDIWYRDVRNIKHTLIKEVILRWDVDPLYLYGLKKEAFMVDTKVY